MVQEWFENNIFTYIVLGIFATGFFVKCLISLKYQSLIRASKRMGTSKNKLMRILRLKFESCYKIKLGVNNVDTFVDKYVYRHRFFGIRLYTWETISGEFVILSTLSASIFALLGVFYKCGRNDILSTLTVGILGSAILLAVDFFVNIRMKRTVLRTNIKDYLENFLKARLESTEFSAELLEQYKKEYFDMPKVNTANMTKRQRRRAKKEQKRIMAAKAAEETKLKKKEKEQADAGIKRREAKKKELKELIAADKKKAGLVDEAKAPLKAVPKPVPKAVSVHKKERKSEQEIAATRHEEPMLRAVGGRNPEKTAQQKAFHADITEEEAKVIEDILKEYLL